MSATSESRAGSVRAAHTTVAPRRAISSAVARPMPLEAPVMTTTCAETGRGRGCPCWCVDGAGAYPIGRRAHAVRPLTTVRAGSASRSARPRTYQPVVEGEHDGSGAVAERELREDVPDVRLDRALTEGEPFGDLRVAQSGPDEGEDLTL